MTRILIFLLWIVLIAFAVTVLTTLNDRISGEAFGYKFDGPSGLILGGVAFAFLAAIYITHKIKDILSLPAKIRAKDAEAKRERGVAALTRGLEAVAVGDAADASHHARVAQKHLQDIALTRLLSAQAAQLSGDEKTATTSFSAMLDSPETEFLGLKGLYAQALKTGDQEQARAYAERAFSLRANAGWAFDSVVDLGLERGAWGETREAIAKGRRNNLISAGKADRASAALLTADAYETMASEDNETALREADAALKLAPGLAPAAVLAAQLYSDKSKTGKAAGILETAFAKDAHPAILRAYDKIYADQQPDKRAEKLRKLAAKNADSREAVLLNARALNLLGEYEEAMTTLESLITAAPDAHAYSLMATAMAGLYGSDVGRGWLERAAAAPRDPRPGADGTFHFNRGGWARLVREYMDHARLAPPPLEDAGDGLSTDELRLLTAPPPKAIAATAVNDDEKTDATDPSEGGSLEEAAKDDAAASDNETPSGDGAEEATTSATADEESTPPTPDKPPAATP